MAKMKASLKLRGGEGPHQKPLVKAKLPINLLGFPIFASIVLGNSEDLALRLGTSQDSGPSFYIGYRPNQPDRPLTLVMKTGLGPWNSSASAALAMAAEFNFSSPSSPTFRLWVKPQLGDFSFRRDFHSSADSNLQGTMPGDQNQLGLDINTGRSDTGFTNSFARYDIQQDALENERLPAPTAEIFEEDRQSVEGIRNHWISGSWEHVGDTMSSSRSFSNTSQRGREIRQQHRSSPNASQNWGMHGLLAGCHLRAHSCLPLWAQAQVKIRWRMQVPPNSPDSFFRVPFFPLLVPDKISVEAPVIVHGHPSLPKLSEKDPKLTELETFFSSLKDALRSVQLENDYLKNAMENVTLEAQNKRMGTGQDMEHKAIIDHPAEESETKQSPLWGQCLDGKRLMD